MARIMREYNDNALKTLIKDASKSSSFFRSILILAIKLESL